MGMEAEKGDIDPQKVLKMAFWDRMISYPTWKRIICGREPDYSDVILRSFTYLPMRWLVEVMEEDKFLLRWPLLREPILASGEPLALRRVPAWDALWGIICVGDSQFPVSQEVSSLPRKKRQLLKIIVLEGICSLHDAAMISGRNYDVVRRDVNYLAQKGLVSVSCHRSGSNGAMTTVVAPASINAELAAVKRRCGAALEPDAD